MGINFVKYCHQGDNRLGEPLQGVDHYGNEPQEIDPQEDKYQDGAWEQDLVENQPLKEDLVIPKTKKRRLIKKPGGALLISSWEPLGSHFGAALKL